MGFFDSMTGMKNSKGEEGFIPTRILALPIPIINLPISIACFIKFKREGEKGRSIFYAILSLILIAAYTWGVFGIIDVIQERKLEEAQEQMLYDSSLFEVAVADKNNIDEDTFSFDVNYKNNNWNRIVGCDIELEVYNHNGVELLKTNITQVDCFDSQEANYNYSVDVTDTEKANELFSTAYEYLEFRITIKMLHYNRGGVECNFDDHRVLKTVDVAKLESAYEEAVNVYNSGNYNKAIEQFSVLGSYKESFTYITNSHNAIKQQEEEAIQRALEAIYQEATALYNKGQYEKAIEKFEEIIEYKDSRDMIATCETAITNTALESSYVSAKALYSQKKYSEAYWAFYDIKEYKDSQTYMTAIVDEVETVSLQYAEVGNYQSAYDILEDMGYSTDERNPNYLPILKAYYCAASGEYKNAVNYGLTKIVLPNGTTEISGFQGCVGLVEVIMPDTVITIANDAFNGCTSLTTLILSTNIKTIGMNAFSNCDSLEEIILPISLESISVKGWNSFDGEIHYAGTVEQWEVVTKEHTFMATLNKTIYCSNGNIEP